MKKKKTSSKKVTVTPAEITPTKEIKPIHPMAVINCEINFEEDALRKLMEKYIPSKQLEEPKDKPKELPEK